MFRICNVNRILPSLCCNNISSLNIHTSLALSARTMEKANIKHGEASMAKALKKTKKKIVQIRSGMTIGDLAEAMERSTQHINDCLDQLKYAQAVKKSGNWTINSLDVIAKVVKLCGFRFQMGNQEETNFDELEADLLRRNETRDSRPKPRVQDLVRRPPVVTIMGHVDHGKTTLLDSLRGTNVVASEFGGITQHIGAFNCLLSESSASGSSRRSITFVDTPGHAIFSEMRSRGARVTDIVVLVVAADDGIMAQTVESIEYAKAARCPIIVAVNKMDRASPDRIEAVKKELMKYDLICEEFGGDVQVVPISALKKTNIDRLKEEIYTLAEVMELKGDPKGLVEGYILESSQDPHRGKLATVLVQRGTLTKSSYLVAGSTLCKVKSMYDENGKVMEKAGLSTAVQVMGWRELPRAGDEVLQVNSEQRAKELVDLRIQLDELKQDRIDCESIKAKRKQHQDFYQAKLKERRLQGRNNRVTFDDFYSSEIINKHNKQGEGKEKDLNVIIKTDVDGSLEAILNVLETYPNDESNNVRINLVHFEVGALKKSDLELAEAFGAIIYCFNLAPNPTLEKSVSQDAAASSEETTTSKQESAPKVIRHFNIIYKLFDDLKVELNLRAPLVELEDQIGEAEVLKVFDYEEKSRKTIQIAGGRCLDGLLEKKSYFRIVRNGNVIFDRETCKSMKHLKNDVNSIKRNVEFGMSFDNEEIRLQPGDRIKCYTVKMVKKPIEWDLGF